MALTGTWTSSLEGLLGLPGSLPLLLGYVVTRITELKIDDIVGKLLDSTTAVLPLSDLGECWDTNPIQNESASLSIFGQSRCQGRNNFVGNDVIQWHMKLTETK